MAIRKATLSSPTLTNLAEVSASGILPARISNATVYDVTIPVWGINRAIGTVIDPDLQHVWINDLTEVRKYRLSDSALIYALDLDALGETIVSGFSLYGSDNFYVVSTNLYLGTFSTESLVSQGQVTVGGSYLTAITREPSSNMAWGVFQDNTLRRFDITAGLNPITPLVTIPYPFNPNLIVQVYSQLENDGTYVYWKTNYAVHRWKMSDQTFLGSIPRLDNGLGTDGEQPISGIAINDDGSVRVRRAFELLSESESFAREGLWVPVDPTTTTDFSDATVPIAIPDASGYAEASIPVTAIGTVDGVLATIRITHTFIGDLRITVYSPDNTPMIVWGKDGGGNNDLDLVLIDLSGTFRGKSADGTWRIRVEDTAGGDVGTIDEATLHFGADGYQESYRQMPKNIAGGNEYTPSSHIIGDLEALLVEPSSFGVYECRVEGSVLSATAGDAQWSYAPPSARRLKGIVLDGDLSRESNDSAASRKTILSYAVGTSPPGAWTEVRPGEALDVAVAEGETIYVKADLDPDGGDQPWIAEAYLLTI